MRDEQPVAERQQLNLVAALTESQGGASRASLRWLLGLAAALGLLLLVRSGIAVANPLDDAASLPPISGNDRFAHVETIGAVEWPVDVEIDGRGWLYVSDRASHSVAVFDHTRRPVGALGVGEDGAPGVLEAPMGIAVDSSGTLYVADRLLRRVLTYDAAGVYTGEFGAGVFEDQARVPAALFLRHGRLYVTDIGRHQVLVLDADGSLLRVVGYGAGADIGQLSYPNGVWVGQDGVIWVSDTNNHRIQRFAPDGRPLGAWGTSVVSPRDLVVDSDGRLYVASALANRVVAFDSDGRPLDEIVGTGGGALMAPTGIALAPERVYGTDRLAGAVQEWRTR